jgi:hypothetical protein
MWMAIHTTGTTSGAADDDGVGSSRHIVDKINPNLIILS